MNSFFMFTFKKNTNFIPRINEMPPMINSREEFALVYGPDQKLYAIGGFNT